MMKSVLTFMLLMVVLSACVTAPQYRDVRKEGEDLRATDVNYQILGPFYRDPPDCVVVMKTKAETSAALTQPVGVALARHLGQKVDRVIFPRKRRALEKRFGLDVTDQADRQRFARQTRCRFYAVAQLYDAGDDYAGVFARKYVGVRVDLKRISDDALLWQAAHTVWRANGGVPLSPVGALSGFASATMFNTDQEILPSLLDDVMRRLVRTLPYGVVAGDLRASH